MSTPEHKETPIMAQYKAMKSQHPQCLLFFRLGEFYELFFEDAKIASAALDIVLTARDKGSDNPIPMCGVPVHSSESYIARLIKKGYHVALCEQTEKAAEKVGKGPIKREVVRIITTGTVVEEGLLESGRHNFLMAMVAEKGCQNLSTASVDITTGDFFVESHPWADLEALLTRMDPQEILLPEALLQQEEWQKLWVQWKTRITPLPGSRFDVENGEERLQGFFGVSTVRSFGAFSPSEVAAAGAVLDYVLLTQKRKVLGISRPQRLEKEDFLSMDAFTQRSLEITQTFSGGKEGSLLGVMDHTLTPMGARLLFLRLTHPLRKRAALENRLDSVEFFVHDAQRREAARAILRGIPDIERALSRLILRKGSPKDLGSLRQALLLLPKLVPFVRHGPTELAQATESLQRGQELAQILRTALSDELPPFLRDGGVIARGYNAQLDEYRHLKVQEERIIADLQKKYVEETGVCTLKIRHNHIIGYYIEVSAQAASKMPFQFVLRQSLVSGSRYVTAELAELEQRLRHASERALSLEENLFEELLCLLDKAHGHLRQVIQALAVIDISSALAHGAVLHGYSRPQLGEDGAFSAQGVRHPVVEAFQKNTPGTSRKPFVKNSCVLEDCCVWLLTGPNMAGKSTFLRQNALLVLMAHMGSFVAADSATVGLVDRLFSRVGASDDLARGHSTFMVEMVETAAILNQATKKSFVILDEVGRGTSTYDGLALAWACVEYLATTVGCRTLFATHYHELTALEAIPAVVCYTLRIAEWGKDILFLYEIIPGASQCSYGLHVAKLAGMPECVLHRAEHLLSQLEREQRSLPAPLL